jgi:hypothetical protein
VRAGALHLPQAAAREGSSSGTAADSCKCAPLTPYALPRPYFCSSHTPAHLPRAGNQLSTDDFLGASPNNTNLALLGVAGCAAYGYLQWASGDAPGANATWTRVGALGAAWVDYAWVDGPAAAAVGGPHARLQYRGTPGAAGAGASDASWSQKYNALWLRVLGFDGALPNQSSLLAAEAAWYTGGGRANPLGLPLDYRQDFTKGDWSLWSAATAYEGAGYGGWTGDPGTPVAGPSPASTALFDGVLRWVNATTSTVPLSDWYHTVPPGAVAGFRARPVWGSVWAPALLSLAGVPAADGGLGMRDGPVTRPALAAARERMAAGRAAYAAGPTPTPLASTYTNPVYGGGDAPDPGVAWDDDSRAWYAATTTGDGVGYGGRFALWTSRSLGAWTLAGTVFPTGWPGAPAWATGSFWAPELWRVGGAWLVYFTARHGATGQLAIGVGVSSTGAVTGPYNDVGAPLVLDASPQKYGMIDATYFRDPADNASYVVFKRDGNAVGAPTPIHWARLTDAGTALAPGQADWHGNVLLTNSLPWENGIVEAPWVVAPPGGGYYLFYSGSGYSGGYALSVARSTSGNFTGPYVKLGAKLLGDAGTSGAPWQAPGHASIVAAPAAMLAGSAAAAAEAAAAGAATPSPLAPYSHAVVYHAYSGSGRTARLMLLDGLVWAPNVTGDGATWPVMAATTAAAAAAGVRVSTALLPAFPSTGAQPLPFGPGVAPPPLPSPTPSSSPVVAPGCPSTFTAVGSATLAATLGHGLRYVSFAQANAPAGSNTYLRHGCYWLFSMPISLTDSTATQDATMVVRLGLDGTPGTVSLQSVNYPGVVLTVQPDGYLQHTALTALSPTYGADGVTVLAPPAVDPAAATWEVVVLANASTAPLANASSAPEALGRNNAVVQLVTRSPAFFGQVVTLGAASTHACGTGMTANVRVAPRASTPTAASAWVVATGGVAAPAAYAANAVGFYTSPLRVVAETMAGASGGVYTYAAVTSSGSVAGGGSPVVLTNASGLWAATAPTAVQAPTAAGSRAGWTVGPPLACGDVCAGGPWTPVSLRSAAAGGGTAYLCDASSAGDVAAGAAVGAVARGAGDAGLSPSAGTWLAKRANVTAASSACCGAVGGRVTGWLLAPPAAVDRGIGDTARLLTAVAGAAGTAASVVVAPVDVAGGGSGLNESHLWRLAWDDGAGTALALPVLATGGALATCPSPSPSPSRTSTRSSLASVTPSLQLSGSGTRSPAPTASGSATPPPTASASGTASLSGSGTPSGSGTLSPGASASGTPSGTGSASVTGSGSPSRSGTRTPPGTGTATGSGTAPATGTTSGTAAATGSGTGSRTMAATPTPSPTPSAPVTRSPTGSRTGSTSGTRSPAPTGSGTSSGTSSGTGSGSASPPASGSGSATPTGTPAPSGSRTPTGAATGSRTGTASPSGSDTRSPSGSGTPTPSPSGSSSETPSTSASRTGTPSPSGSPSATASVSATGSGSRTASAAPTRTATRTATPTKSVPPSSSATRSRSASGSRSATPTVTGSATRSPSRSRSPSGTWSPSRSRAGSRSRTPTRVSRSGSPTRSVTRSRTRKPKRER